MDTQTAETLFRSAVAGAPDAFAELVEPHRTRLLAVIRLRLPSSQRAQFDPEDILQTTFVQALELLPQFAWQGQRAFAAWLTTIATNRVRRTWSTRHGVSAMDDHCEQSPDASMPSPLRRLRQEERFDRLEEALTELTPMHREVVVLARIEGLRIADIAKRMGRTPSATSMLLLRALRALRNAFGETESLSLPERSLLRKS